MINVILDHHTVITNPQSNQLHQSYEHQKSVHLQQNQQNEDLQHIQSNGNNDDSIVNVHIQGQQTGEVEEHTHLDKLKNTSHEQQLQKVNLAKENSNEHLKENHFLVSEEKKNKKRQKNEGSQKEQQIQRHPQQNMKQKQKVKNQEVKASKVEQKQQKQQPFMWGEESKPSVFDKKQTYSHLFLNSNLNDHLIDALGKSQNKQEEFDIWGEIRKQVSQNKKHFVNKIIKSNNQKEKDIDQEKTKAYKKVHNTLQIARSQSIGKETSSKVKQWMKQHKQLSLRRLNIIADQQERRRIQMSKIEQEKQMQKVEKRRIRLEEIERKKQIKKSKEKQVTKSENHNGSIKKQKSLRQKKYQVETLENERNFKLNEYLEEKQKLLRRKIFDQKVREVPIVVTQNQNLKLLNEFMKQAKGKNKFGVKEIHEKERKGSINTQKQTGSELAKDLVKKGRIKRYLSQKQIIREAKQMVDDKHSLIQKLKRAKSQLKNYASDGKNIQKQFSMLKKK